jgi:hypothetical protein
VARHIFQACPVCIYTQSNITSIRGRLLVQSWSPRLPLKLGEPGSIFGRTSTQGLKIIEEKVLYLYIDISKCLDFRIFLDKDV